MKKTITSFLFVALLLFSFGFINQKESPTKQLEASLQAQFDSVLLTTNAPGATLALILPSDNTINIATGLSDKELQIKMKPTDRMLSGSIGKTYCAAIILQLAEEGKLSLDDKAKKYFEGEDWFKRIQNWETVTIRHLLNHTSGITNHVAMDDFAKNLFKDPDKVWDMHDLLALIYDLEPLFPAGTSYNYSDSNYFILGLIIEKLTKDTYYGELDKRILKPFGLVNTIPSISRKLEGLIVGYSKPDNRYGLPVKLMKDGLYVMNPQAEWTGGGLVSNTYDLAKWAKLLYEGKYIKPASVDSMLVGFITNPSVPDAMLYGLGVCIAKFNGTDVCYGHYGSYPGYRSMVMYNPKYKYAIAVQVNTEIDAQKQNDFIAAMLPVINQYMKQNK